MRPSEELHEMRHISHILLVLPREYKHLQIVYIAVNLIHNAPHRHVQVIDDYEAFEVMGCGVLLGTAEEVRCELFE
jgi:hypothetical protein